MLLDETKLKSFLYAVKNHYWYQMYIDDLPVWGEPTFDQVGYFDRSSQRLIHETKKVVE